MIGVNLLLVTMKNTLLHYIIIGATLSSIVLSCESLNDIYAPREPEENQLLDGPIEGLTTQEQIQFLHGDIAFNDEVFTVEKGLGPVFVGNRCAACHAGDGKGHPFNGFIRFGQSDSLGNPYATFGDKRNQLQNKAIPGYQPQVLPEGAPFSLFIGPAVTGLGYLDAVSDADILALADPDDLDGDGISGRPHYAYPPDYVQLRSNSIPKDGKYIFRFGKKASTYDLLHQTADAYNQDMGIVSIFQPNEPYDGLPNDPEVSKRTIGDVVFYLKTLKAPLPRNQDDPKVMAGKAIFNNIQCAACHVPTLRTSYSPIEALSYKEFHPYTDLLLHDMGPGLDDGYTEGYALTSEYRTPPLWGLGLSADSQGGQVYLMHDGRARSIEEAILLHGGEAENSKNNYVNLSALEQEQLLAFLNSL